MSRLMSAVTGAAIAAVLSLASAYATSAVPHGDAGIPQQSQLAVSR